MHDDPFHDLRKQSSGRTIFDYDIESDLYACFLRWFLTRFVWWFFGPLALFGILVYLYALCFYQPPADWNAPAWNRKRRRRPFGSAKTISSIEEVFR